MIDFEDRPYRPCVGIVLRNNDHHVLVGQRLKNSVEAWQMPQGGIDDGETALEAGYREMAEEIGTQKATFIAEHSSWLDYDIPVDLANKLWGGRFRGQTQKWILFQFDGTDEDINIETEDPEFSAWKWAEPKLLPDLAVPFKRDVYTDVLEEFRDKL
jgi:putative (di)nucleoside polyphosphate hydrolase